MAWFSLLNIKFHYFTVFLCRLSQIMLKKTPFHCKLQQQQQKRIINRWLVIESFEYWDIKNREISLTSSSKILISLRTLCWVRIHCNLNRDSLRLPSLVFSGGVWFFSHLSKLILWFIRLHIHIFCIYRTSKNVLLWRQNQCMLHLIRTKLTYLSYWS